MRNVITLSALSLGLIASTAALADGKTFVNLGLGMGGSLTPTSVITQGATGDSYSVRGFAARGSIGYLFNIMNSGFSYGAELGYNHFAKNSYTVSGGPDYSLSYQSYAIDALGIARYTMNDFFFQGKAGAAYVNEAIDTNAGYQAATGVASTTKGAVRPEVGAGMGYNFTKHISADVDYSHIFGTEPSISDTSSPSNITQIAPINVLMLNLSFNF